jgi:predicted nucleic acid-binding Zn ribbon protein
MHTPKMIDISSVINNLSKSLGFEQKMVESSLQKKWGEIMGEKIANHTIPGQIRYKKLYIEVDNPVWMHQLLFLKDEILNRVNRTIGREIINEVRFKLGTGLDKHTDDYTKQDSTQMTSAALYVIPT